MYINHLTLSTGHLARTSRADVADEVLASLAPWLQRAVAHDGPVPLPVAPLSHYSARAIVEGGGLVVTIYGPIGPHEPGKPHDGQSTPLVTLGVAQRSRHGGELWAMLVAQFGARAGLSKPGEPWCAVATHAGMAAHREAARWLGDLERCIAWAWITRSPDLRGVE